MCKSDNFVHIGYENVVLSIYIVIQFQGKFENILFYSHFRVYIFFDLDLISFCLDVVYQKIWNLRKNLCEILQIQREILTI